jgi:hypothetical protein
MRNRFLCLCVILAMLAPGITFAQKSKSWLKSGAVLTYQISTKGKQYDFIIRNLQLETNISFDWEMTEPNALIGSMVIGGHALDTATSQKNYFQDGENLLNDRTTVWVSKAVYNALKKKSAITINSGSGRSPLTYKGKEDFTFKLNGEDKTVKSLYAETNSAEKFWILDDKESPLILKMNLGWLVVLKSVSF